MNISQFVLAWSFNVVFNIFKTQWDESYEVEQICKNYIYFELTAHLLFNVYNTTFPTCFGVNDITEDGLYY